MPIRIRTIRINQKKTPSTSKETKPCYYLSICDILWNILNNPSLYDKLYFGPGIEAKEKKEFWHGELWAESPLLGQDKIIIDRGTLIWCYYYKRIRYLIYFSFLLRNLSSK